MTESRWRTLIEVADAGSIRGAAARLVVTESAVSASVASLAKDLGVPLLERVGRGIALTPAGLRYADYLRRVVGLLEEGASAARGELDPARGQVRLGCVTTLADDVVPRLLGRFRAAYPQTGVRLEVGPSAHVWTLLADHRVDVVLGGRPPAGADVEVRARRSNDLVVVAAPDVAAAFEPAATTWLLREPGSGTRATTEALLAELGAAGPTMTLGSNGAVVAGARAGLGVTLVSRQAVAADLATGALVLVDLPGVPLDRPWYLSARPGPAPTVHLFTGFVTGAGAGDDRWTPMRARRPR